MSEALIIHDLRCEYLKDPLGIETRDPRLSWKVDREAHGYRQTAYQIQFAEDENFKPDSLLFDTGRVHTSSSHLVRTGFEPVKSGQRIYWRVRIWDEEEKVSDYSEPGWYEFGLLRAEDWQADWIESTVIGGKWTSAPCPFFRCSFSLDKPISSARLYITALGVYEGFINGCRIGDEYLRPGWTDPAHRLYYQVYDVTHLLQQGGNAVGVILGDGWFCGHLAWKGRQNYGLRPRLLAQLMVTYEDGSAAIIATGPDWKTATGPILFSDLIMGEAYDARLTFGPWSEPDFDDSSWAKVHLWEPDKPFLLMISPSPPVRIVKLLSPIDDPVCINEWPWKKYIFDFGQNMVGKVRLKVSGTRGQTIIIRHGEVLDAEGRLYTDNLRSAQETLYYTLRGGGEEESYEPRFTFMGFRYIEVSGLQEPPERDLVTALVLHTDLERTGDFECSDPLINQLQHNILWSQKGNYLEVPTDCPQRDERLGWTGDAQVFVDTAAFNMQIAPFFSKWLADVRDAQQPDGLVPPVAPAVALGEDANLQNGGPGWSDAVVICPWVIYQRYGDLQILENMYPAMKAFMGYLDTHLVEGVRAHPDDSGFRGFGDWLSIDADTPKDLIGTAFHAYSAGLMARIAACIGREEDAGNFRLIRSQVREKFIQRFITPGGLIISQTQTAMVLSLAFDLVPESMKPKMVQSLVRDIQDRGTHLSCGFLGTPHILNVLAEAGETETAFDLLFQNEWPSWLYAVRQGATTIWERWDGWTEENGFQDAGMNSFNHYAYGAVGSWLYTYLAGIRPDADHPGYKRFILRPSLDPRMSFARAELESPYGTIRSAWRVDEHGKFSWDIAVPENSQAVVYIPIRPDWRLFLADGNGSEGSIIVTFDLPEKREVFTLESGLYHIEVAPPRFV